MMIRLILINFFPQLELLYHLYKCQLIQVTCLKLKVVL